MRVPEAGVAALAAAAMLTWAAALVTSLPPPLPVLVVIADARAVEGAPWVARFVAVAPGGRAPLDVTGEVRLGEQRARIEGGVARVDAAHLGPDGTARVVLDVVANDTRLRGAADVSAAVASPGAALQWSPWFAEVALRSAATAPVYPLDGRVSARLPSDVLVLEPPRVVRLTPSAGGAALDDGRVLQVDRSGLRVRLPLEVSGTVTARVESADDTVAACDLLIDGAVHDVVVVPLKAGAAVDVPFRLGTHGSPAAPDAVVVVHCGGVYADALGRSAVARTVADPAETPLAVWLRARARDAGAHADEPLLALDDAALAQPDAARAALARLVPSLVRAPRLDVAWAADSGPGGALRGAYGALALAVVAAALALGLARMPRRRGAVVAGVAALAAVLGGLYAALVVVAP